MLTPEHSREALIKLFREERVVDLATLYKVLQTESRMSVFRRLSTLGYLSSYSHTGRYYTLADIPTFDADGLWQYQGVFFSRHGSLKPTVEYLVDVSEDGRTHEELYLRLLVRVHNALLQLVRQGRIGRETVGHVYVYVSSDEERSVMQITQRRSQVIAQLTVSAEPSASLLTEVLLEVIRGAKSVPDPEVVNKRLTLRDIGVTLQQVEAIFKSYGLKKGAHLRSRRSRR